jgi:hypothetical protein
MKESLADYNGELCVCQKMTFHDKPKYALVYFPTGIKTKEFETNYYPINECQIIQMGSSYGILRKGLNYEKTLTLNLKDGIHTKQIGYDEYDIPCPKVKKGINTRWSSWAGRWEKELKKGWVSA